ncbi:MAG TPA: YdaS family helix-turn-helix protein [Burkholderiales bacterium]|nr:YdaS family helix-turn-helix protein [Burkholderiales bacterium]
MRDLGAAARDCPLAPPGHASVQARALHRACVIVGGAAQLARNLDVAVADVERWLVGDEAVPERIFLHAVEIVLLHASGGDQRKSS